jgi:hypothetical protein
MTPSAPTGADISNKIQGYVNAQTKSFIYKGYNGLDFMKEFSSSVLSFIPYLNLPIGETNTQKINAALQAEAKSLLDDAVPNAVYNCITGFTGKYMRTLGRYIEAKSPRALYVQRNNSEIKTFMNGVATYGRGHEKVVRFDMSFGVTLKFGGSSPSYSPYLPSSFEIEQIDMFGAAYYGGQWRGVRYIG